MVIKPRLDWTWTVVIVTVLSLAAIAVVFRAYKQEAVTAPGGTATETV